MTFKTEYRKAVEGIVPSDDFFERLKTAVSAEAAQEHEKTSAEQPASIGEYRRRRSAVKKVIAGIASAACIVIIAGVVLHAFGSVSTDLAETVGMTAENGEETYSAALTAGGTEKDAESVAEEEAECYSVDTYALEGAAPEAAEEEKSADFMVGSAYGAVDGASDGAALNTFVEQVSAEAIALDPDCTDDSDGDDSGDWIQLSISSEDVEAFAEMLYGSSAYSLVGELENSLASSENSDDPMYELCLTLSDGSSLTLQAYESGTVVIEELQLVVYLECGSDAFLNVWNACASAE